MRWVVPSMVVGATFLFGLRIQSDDGWLPATATEEQTRRVQKPAPSPGGYLLQPTAIHTRL